jgi:hypothetical protein
VYGEPAAETGDPLIVTVFPVTVAVTPLGNPVTVAPVAVPPKVYVIALIAPFSQTVCAAVAGADVSAKVANGCTVIVPVKVGAPQVPPVVATLNVYGEPAKTLGVPLIMTEFPEIVEETPVGSPVTVAPVAEPPKVYTILVMGSLIQTI